MQLIFLTFITMLAFAGNSLLTRAALAYGAIDAGSFSIIRLLSGATVLMAIIVLQGKKIPAPNKTNWKMAFALLVYVLGFSFAYLHLDTGLGALILFGVVQLTMQIGALLKGETLRMQQIFGALIAFGGLVFLLMPSELDVPFMPSILMIFAAIGWGVYSLMGKSAGAPLLVTGVNFVLATILCAGVIFLLPHVVHIKTSGIILAIISGAVTSGLGYSLWYYILPKLPSATAASVQLSVPVLAMILGAIFLGESLGARALFCAVIILGGIALIVKPKLR